MKTRILTLLLGILLSTNTSAELTSVNMLGAGKVSCKEWQSQRATTEYFSAGNWILGFLSATAWSTGEDILTASKADALFNAIDGYCEKHPKQSIADAAMELVDHLRDKTSPE
ncbi:MAG: hypothetical protein KAJ95_02405 [Gammaproteobacteria bacterium]|nr:hypothetical protein [Gammaproteobacteria bacterium]